MKTVEETYQELDQKLKSASIAQIGGFKPPENKLTSWFNGDGFALPDEKRPQYKGKDMICILQIRIDELQVVPEDIENAAFICVFTNQEVVPFDLPHGEGWLVREYSSLDNLVPLAPAEKLLNTKDFPIQWHEVKNDAPGWETAWEVVNMDPINDTEAADEKFFTEYERFPCTKVGGYPAEIQHIHETDGFCFQIGSEEKPNWMWGDNGIAYFNKTEFGDWEFDCQQY